ncbi:MAG: tetratricopeptide repeat protein [Geminicoccaceae bacterium]
MTTILRSYWRLSAAAVGLAAILSACAPNSAKKMTVPSVDSSLATAEQEKGRYGTLLRLASSTREAGDPAAAVNMYQQAISLERSRPEAYTLLGYTLIDLQAYDQAAEIFQQSLERNKDNVTARLGYARVLLALKRPESAIPHYEVALRQAPDDIQVYNGLGVAYDLTGDHQTAQTVYRDGLAIAPDSMFLRNNLGLSLALAGEHKDAISLLRMVVDEPGARARNRQNLALAHGLAGDLAAAERISRLDLDEDSVESNLAYFATLSAIDDKRKRAAALSGQPSSDAEVTDQGEATKPRLTALALGGEGLELALMPTGRWFLNLGDFSNDRQAASAWRQLRADHQDLLSSFDRLAGSQQGSQPLLVGPLATVEAAEQLCDNLEGRGQTCRALAL